MVHSFDETRLQGIIVADHPDQYDEYLQAHLAEGISRCVITELCLQLKNGCTGNVHVDRSFYNMVGLW